MEKVKGVILYIGAFDLPDNNAAAHRVIGNSKVLEKLGYEIFLAGFTTKKNVHNTHLQYKDTSINYFEVKRPVTIFNWIYFILSLNKIIKNVEKKIDIIIAYDFPSIGLILLTIIAKIKSIRIIGDCTEWYDIKNKNFIGIIKKIDIALRMRLINKYLSGLIVISDYLFDYYKKCQNVINIPPLVDLSEQKWAIKSIQNNYIVITYAGFPFSLEDGNIKDKIDLILINLNKLMKKGYVFKFNIIGCDRDLFVKKFPLLKNEVDNLENNITFLGKLNHNQVLQQLKISDFAIFFRDVKKSTLAGFPTKYVEAISCGVPVITNKNFNLNKHLINNHNGFIIDISTSNKILESLETILKLKPNEIEKIKKNVLTSQTFNYSNYLKEFKKIF
jgi:glycosyltransferase involved in cell wall biosynthesis